MKKFDITYEEFKKHLDAVKRNMQFQDGLIDLVVAFNKDSRDECELMLPMMVDNVVDLLALATHDEDDWIAYWVFDLDCGKEYEDGCVTEGDGSIVKLETIEDLWNCLVKNFQTET